MKKLVGLTALICSLFTASAVMAASVNINKADVATLDTIEGIGAKKAEAIVAWRTQHGEFKSLEQLKQVPGIGEKLFEKIKANVALTDGDTAAASTTASATPTTTPAAENKPTTEAKPSVVTETKPSTPEVKPSAAEIKPSTPADVKPTAATETKPSAAAETKPATTSDAKIDAPTNAKVTTEAHS